MFITQNRLCLIRRRWRSPMSPLPKASSPRQINGSGRTSKRCETLWKRPPGKSIAMGNGADTDINDIKTRKRHGFRCWSVPENKYIVYGCCWCIVFACSLMFYFILCLHLRSFKYRSLVCGVIICKHFGHPSWCYDAFFGALGQNLMSCHAMHFYQVRMNYSIYSILIYCLYIM